MQYGASSYKSIRPAKDAGDCDGLTSGTEATAGGSDEGLSTAAMIGIGVAAGVVVVGGAVVAMRRRRTVGDRE